MGGGCLGERGGYKVSLRKALARVDRWLLFPTCCRHGCDDGGGRAVNALDVCACVCKALLFVLTTAASTRQHEDTHAAQQDGVYIETEAFLVFLHVAAAWDVDVCVHSTLCAAC